MSILITGATSGIGLATAVALSGQGRDVALVGRTAQSVGRAQALVRALGGAGMVTGYTADLARGAEVEALADAVQRDRAHLEALVLAAAVVNPESPVTDGVDTTLAVNHLAPARLVALLDPTLDGGRIVLFGSSRHGAAGPFDPAVFDLDGPATAARRYEATKLLTLLHAAARRARPHIAPLEVIDPGFVRTNLGRRASGALRVLLRLTRPFQASPDRPAAFVTGRLHADDFADGAYRNAKGRGRLAANASDEIAVERAWAWTQAQLGAADR